MKQIPHSRTRITLSDAVAVLRILRTGRVNDSSETRALEAFFAVRHKANFSRATNSGTHALTLAIKSMISREGTCVFTSTYVCEDVAEAIEASGAVPIYCDIEPLNFNISPDDLERKINWVRDQGLVAGPIVVPHMFGAAADMERILAKGLPVIEDLSHAVGGQLNGLDLGTFGDATIVSLHALKVVTAGEGGVVTWRSEPSLNLLDSENHMSNLNSSLALSQLGRLDKIVHTHRLIAEAYIEEIESRARGVFIIQRPLRNSLPTWFRFVLLLARACSLELVRKSLLDRGIVTQRPVKKLLHRARLTSFVDKSASYEIAEDVWNRALSLPAHLWMKPRMATRISRILIDTVGQK
jgi:dTDP-4-amino-4,6-dideoxygalactose transaminase